MTNADLGYVLHMPFDGQTRRVPKRLRVIVAANVRRLMNRTRDLSSPTNLGAKAGVGKRTVNRLLGMKNAATLDTIEAVADALDVDPYELLIPHRIGTEVREESPQSENGYIPRRTARRNRNLR